MSKVIKLTKQAILLERLEDLCARFGAEGGIVIIQTKSGSRIAQYNLSAEKVRGNLCLAIYYNEKLDLHGRSVLLTGVYQAKRPTKKPKPARRKK